VSKPLEPSFSLRTPPGEDRDRRVCDHCGFIDYVNPRIVVGAVAAWSDKGPAFGPDAVALEDIQILLCRRAIMPRRGFWTLPAGFMETQETVADGTRREAREEAEVELSLDAVLAIYDVAHLSQVQIFHRAALPSAQIGAGEETLESRLFAWADIPWKALAFHSVSWALLAFEASRLQARFAPFANPEGEKGWRFPQGV
jgi:ADP-ribose pyrophosphatase YjhB (NUDIX family)